MSTRYAACLLGALFASSVVAETDSDPQLLFEQALEERETGDLQVAIDTFQSLLQRYPSLNRARLELAVAYYQALNFAEARRQAESVMSNPQTPEAVKKRIRAFLDRIKQSSRPHKWSPFVEVGVMYDSNVNAGPENDTVQVNGGTITLVPGATERSANGAIANAGVSHRYLSPTTVDVNGRDTAFLWYNQASFYGTRYNNAADRNLDVVTLSTGPAWIAAREWRAQINAELNYLRLGFESYARFAGLTPAVTWPFQHGRTEVTWEATVQHRDYSQSVDEGRDGNYVSTGAQVYHQLPGDTVSVEGGVEIYQHRATAERFEHQGYELSLNGIYQLGKYGSLFARASTRTAEHDGDEPAFGEARDERRNRISVGFNRTIRSGQLQGWNVKATASYTRNLSNIGIYDYRRRQIALNIGRSF